MVLIVGWSNCLNERAILNTLLDQPYKTEADLGGTVETVLPGDVNPVPPLLKTFGMPGYFPELKSKNVLFQVQDTLYNMTVKRSLVLNIMSVT